MLDHLKSESIRLGNYRAHELQYEAPDGCAGFWSSQREKNDEKDTFFGGIRRQPDVFF